MLQTLYDSFWNHYLWLPPNLTWADVEDQEGRVYAKASDLYVTIPLAFVFLVVRYFFEIHVAGPLGRALGVKDKVRLRVVLNPALEKFYVRTSKHPKQTDLENLSKASNFTVRQVERWFRRRRNQDRPSLQKKFREASWRFTFYLLAFIAGMAVLVDQCSGLLQDGTILLHVYKTKEVEPQAVRVMVVLFVTTPADWMAVFMKPWFHDLREVWKEFPKQTMLPSQYWYYMIELGFYWSLLFSVAFDVKRKDFKEQIIHHVATIVLISFSWCANYIRVGTLILATHDASDYFLESAKMFNYAGWTETCNSIFVVFAVVFIVTRIIILPFWILHCTWVYPLEIYPPFFGYYFFNVMLWILQCLHIFWAYLILRMAHKFLTGKLEQDERSDRDETDTTDNDDEEEREPVKNGTVSNGHSLQNNNHHKAD